MITLLASIAGFISSIVPECLKMFKDKNDKKHEIEVMLKQIEIAKLNIENKLQEVVTIHDNDEQRTLYSTVITGVSWVDALNGTVRPVMAYSFFGLYALVKWIQYESIRRLNDAMVNHIEVLWNTDDQAIFAGIISFYFGQRTFSKLWKVK